MEGSRAAYHNNNNTSSGIGKLDRFEAYGKAGALVSMRRSLDEPQQMPSLGVVTTHISAQEMPAARLKHYPALAGHKANARSTSQDTDAPILYERDEEGGDVEMVGSSGSTSSNSSSSNTTTHTVKGSLGGITVSVGHVVSVEEDGVEVVGLPDLGLGLTRSLEDEYRIGEEEEVVGRNNRGRARGRVGSLGNVYQPR